ncbi:MAG TPA: copper chaperone PCu(A)C, partial [Burkholderiales bacterium]|nr:copper chaperone PCu(A)C [Burkholderiales bacterium]
LHTMTVEEGVMRMRRLERLPIAGNQTIRLEPGGTHLMLLGVKAPLKAGEKVPLELLVEQDGRQTRVKIEADVRALAPVHRH